MVLVFDLDDTLYEELSFVRSGFGAVASYLSLRYKVREGTVYGSLLKELELRGRGSVFDRVLLQFGIYSKNSSKKGVGTIFV